MIRVILIGLSLIFLSWRSSAHNPDLSSTILSKQRESKWMLQVRASLTAYEYEVHLHFGEDAYATPEAFQELVIKHVKENIAIQFGGNQKIFLENSLVKLGHETNVIFEVKGVPENFDHLRITNSSFKNISRNQSALIIFKEGLEKKQFTLNNANQHTADLTIQNGQLISLNPTKIKTTTKSNLSLFLGTGLLGCFLGFLIFLKFKSSKNKI